jgi:hypothetical protein
MIGDVERRHWQESSDRQVTSWRVVISAWLLVLIFIMLLTGAKAVARLYAGPHHHGHLAGAMIPRHDACSGPEIASAPGLNGCENLPVYQDPCAYW